MSLRSGRQPHWIIVASCLAIVAVATTVAVASEPKAKSATASGAGSVPGGTAASGSSASVSASGSAGASAAAGGPSTSPRAHKVNFGLAYGSSLLNQSDAALAASLNDAVEVGARWLRTDLPWDAIQTVSPTQYNWQKFDRIVT